MQSPHPHTHLVEMQNGAAALENCLPVPQTIKHKATIWSDKYLAEIKAYSHTKTCT